MSRLPRCVSLKRILPSASFVGCADVVTESICDRSADVRDGDLFVARKGLQFDGHEFAADAVARGAESLLCTRPLPDIDVPQCVVPCSADAYGRICQALHGFPTMTLPVVGVTGTDGKTTTCWLLRSILSQGADGRPPRAVALCGTIDIDDGLMPQPSSMTTPGPMELAEWLGRSRSHGVAAAVMELSSHALDQKRAAGVQLDAAIVTSLARDHLDYHQTEEAYARSKAAIATMLKRGGKVILAASAADAILRQNPMAGPQLVIYGEHEAATASVLIREESADGLELTLSFGRHQIDVRSPLIGRHNADNILAAALAASHLGATPAMIQDGVAAVHLVPGRLEAIDTDGSYHVYVDYAHTPKAIETVLAAARRIAANRVVAVCGAGGERDIGKRAEMGRALQKADRVILTSDNPRSEDPAIICQNIAAGLGAEHDVVLDRQAAIQTAIEQVGAGDVVLVLGKGHETTQRFADRVVPFDDREVCAQAIARFRSGIPVA